VSRNGKKVVRIDASFDADGLEEYSVVVNKDCVTDVIREKADYEMARVLGHAAAAHDLILADRAIDQLMQRRKDGEYVGRVNIRR
jgi:hypothetical protein